MGYTTFSDKPICDDFRDKKYRMKIIRLLQVIRFSEWSDVINLRFDKSLLQHRIAPAGAVFQDPRALRPGPWGDTSRYRLPVLPAADVTGTPQMFDKFDGHKGQLSERLWKTQNLDSRQILKKLQYDVISHNSTYVHIYIYIFTYIYIYYR